ncbi:MAG: metal-dependent hydrolase [Candidatus Omnitrophica bacterium]|nr:metal-dependent hydrolase [Candidatus Omnitrophota bacterium]
MPFPVLHSFAGYSVSRLVSPSRHLPDWKVMAGCVFLANLADLDFLPGLLAGKGDLFHHGISHSFGAAFAVGLTVAAVLKLWKRTAFLKSFWVGFLAYVTHILLDFYNGSWKGMPLFWPLTDLRFSSPVTFLSVGEIDPLAQGGFGAFARHFLQAACWRQLAFEIFLVVLVCSIAVLGNLLVRKSPAPVLVPEE